VRFSINRELAVAVQNSRRALVASAEKLFQSLSSHPIRERYYFSVILRRSKTNLPISIAILVFCSDALFPRQTGIH
jgi:hypothetical protein